MAQDTTADPGKDNPQKTGATGEGGSKALTGGEQTPAAASSTKGGDPQLPALHSQFDKDLMGHPSLMKFKDATSLGRSYVELEGELGKRIAPLKENATAEERAEFYKKVGLDMPENPDGYELSTANLPKGFKILPEREKEVRQMLFDEHVPKAGAQRIWDYYHKTLAADIAAARAMIPTEAEGTAALQKEYGPQYPVVRRAIDRALTLVMDEEVKALYDLTGLGNHPLILKQWAKIGDMIREDKMLHTSGGAEKKSPAEVLYGETTQRSE